MVKSETEALRMPNLHLAKDQVQALTTFLLGSQESGLARQLPVPPAGYAPRHSGRLVDRHQVQLRGLPSILSRPGI